MTVTDQYGCSDDTTVTVEEPDVLFANSTAQDSVSCFGLLDGKASVTAIGEMGIIVIYGMLVLEVRRVTRLLI